MQTCIAGHMFNLGVIRQWSNRIRGRQLHSNG